VCPRIYSWWFEISVGIQHEHTYNADLFFLLVFFFLCVHREHIVKQGPTLSSCCVPFFLFFLYLKSKGVDIRTTTFFFFDRGICFFIFGRVGISLFWWTARKFRVTNFKGKIEADTNGIDFLWKTIFESPAADAVLPQNYKCRCVCV
jgi:hypothetical protein